MSNSGSLNNGTNGRPSANKTSSSSSSSSMTANSMSIIHTHKDTLDGNALPLLGKSSKSSNSSTLANVTTAGSAITTTTTKSITTAKSNNNENISSHLGNSHNNAAVSATGTVKINPTTKSNINIIQTHRRDNSNLSGQRDARKYQYIKPQQKRLETKPTSSSSPTKTSSSSLSSSPLSELTSTATADECDKRDMSLVYYGDSLVSANLDALILHMVPTHEYYPDKNFIFSFLLSARLFIRPHELLARISQTWEQQQQQQQLHQQQQLQQSQNQHPHQHHMDRSSIDVVDEANIRERQMVGIMPPTSASPLTQRKTPYNDLASVTAPIQKPARTTTQKSAQNCIRLLSDWIETFPYDFRDERLMQQVRILARKCVYIDNALGKQVSRILQLLVQRLTALEKYEEFLQSLLATDLSHNSSISGSNLLQHYSTSASAAYHAISSNSSSGSASVSSEAHHKHLLSGTATAASLACGTGSNAHHSSSHSDSNEVFGLMDLCPSCAHLAHQLTAIELERLSHIGPEEFVQAFAKEYSQNISNNSNSSQNSCNSSGSSNVNLGGSYSSTANQSSANTMSSSSLNDMKKTRNLESYVEWFNRLSYLTASEIVKYPKKKQRVRVIEYWIETARECFNIGNFNSLMAIIAGLNLAPISRLKKTWSKVQSAKFSVLEHQMDPTSNFNSYRSTLKAAMWRSEGATEARERIVIPFFSLFVKDLYFLNEGCSNRLPNNHINFEKCSQLAKQVMEFNEWKKVACPFDQLPNVIQYLQTCPILNENTLSMASFECEPPENTEEKGRYKTVKAETKQQLLQQLQEQQLHHQQHQQPH